MSSMWKNVSVRTILSRAREPVELQDDIVYSQVTVRLHHKGVVLRDEKAGQEIRTKRQFLARAGQLILSRIDARNGAIGLVPDELDGAVVTNDFWVYNLDESCVDPLFFDLYCGTPTFVEQCQSASEGTTNRVRLQEPGFLSIEMPLPPLAEQRRIVARIEELAALVEEAQALRVKAREEGRTLLRSTLQGAFGMGLGSPDDWPTLSPIVAHIENGWSPACLPYPADQGEWGVLKVGAVSTGQFVPDENKALPPSLEPRPELEIRDGDFLFGRANTRELVGACAVVENPPGRLMLCDKVFRFVFRPDAKVDKSYLDFALKSPPLREQIESVASGTSSSMKNISKAKVMRLRVPLPSLAEQRRIVAYLDDLRAQVDELTALQGATQAELDALLPSVLDRAFRGEL